MQLRHSALTPTNIAKVFYIQVWSIEKIDSLGGQNILDAE